MTWSLPRHPRRIFYAPRGGIDTWPLDALPAGKSGTGLETKYTSYLDIPKPYPVGAGIFSVPAARLSLEAGGALTACCEFSGPGVWLTGAGAPDDGTGFDGDYYLDLLSGSSYGPKDNATWSGTGPNLIADPGSGTWLTGATAPDDATGADGDYYFNTVAFQWYGPKAAGTWSGTGPHDLTAPDDAEISAPSVAILASVFGFTDYAIPGGTASADDYDETGTYYSAWVDLSVPIPDGAAGLLVGGSAYLNNGGKYLDSAPYEWSCGATAAIELGNNGGLVQTIDLHQIIESLTATGGWVSDSDSNAMADTNAELTVLAQITKARAKLSVGTSNNAKPYCTISGLVLRAIS
jgi:hypothetical protein